MGAIESSKPKKQRKAHYGMALHRKQHCLAAHVDKKLRQQLGTRSVALRKGDTVKVMRGGRGGSSGKITGVDYGRCVVFVEKVIRKKANGEEIPLPIHASNLLVVDVDRGDSKRFKAGKPREAGKGKKPEKGGA